MKRESSFFLTRQAALALRDIDKQSRDKWGDQRTERYIRSLYTAMEQAAKNPSAGKIRVKRSAPFLMIAAEGHFILYDKMRSGIVILALLHQRCDIENLILAMTPGFLKEIERLKKRLGSD